MPGLVKDAVDRRSSMERLVPTKVEVVQERDVGGPEYVRAPTVWARVWRIS